MSGIEAVGLDKLLKRAEQASNLYVDYANKAGDQLVVVHDAADELNFALAKNFNAYPDETTVMAVYEGKIVQIKKWCRFNEDVHALVTQVEFEQPVSYDDSFIHIDDWQEIKILSDGFWMPVTVECQHCEYKGHHGIVFPGGFKDPFRNSTGEKYRWYHVFNRPLKCPNCGGANPFLSNLRASVVLGTHKMNEETMPEAFDSVVLEYVKWRVETEAEVLPSDKQKEVSEELQAVFNALSNKEVSSVFQGLVGFFMNLADEIMALPSVPEEGKHLVYNRFGMLACFLMPLTGVVSTYSAKQEMFKLMRERYDYLMSLESQKGKG